MNRIILSVLLAAVAMVLVVVGFGWLQEYRQAELAAPRMAGDPSALPPADVGLVLGTGPRNYRRGSGIGPNPTFIRRLDAAATLWRSGKVHYLLLSGRREGDYDEPTAMRAGLIERGVPADIIYRDFSGRRTVDSILRARSIYGLRHMIVVSQRSHLQRALYLAAAAGIDAWGLAARDDNPGGPYLRLRMTLIAVALLAWWDVTTGIQSRDNDAPIVIGAGRPE